MTDTQPQPPLTLTYDNYSPAKDPRSRWILPAYWLGTFLTLIVHVPVTTFLCLMPDSAPTLSVWIDGIFVSLGMALFSILPATVSLGLTLWLRAKFLHHARFSRFRTALLAGFIGGLFPLAELIALRATYNFKLISLLSALAWHTLYPIAAGFWLCHKSHLRD